MHWCLLWALITSMEKNKPVSCYKMDYSRFFFRFQKPVLSLFCSSSKNRIHCQHYYWGTCGYSRVITSFLTVKQQCCKYITGEPKIVDGTPNNIQHSQEEHRWAPYFEQKHKTCVYFVNLRMPEIWCRYFNRKLLLLSCGQRIVSDVYLQHVTKNVSGLVAGCLLQNSETYVISKFLICLDGKSTSAVKCLRFFRKQQIT